MADEPQVLIPGMFDEAVETGNFPAANLLPPAIRLRREVAKAKRRAGAMLAAVVALLGLLTLFTMVQQNAANAARDAAQAQLDAALVQKQRYSYVPAVYLAVSSARKELAAAMGQEVQVSRLMSGLASFQTAGVSLQTWELTAGPGQQTTQTSAAQAAEQSVGTVTITGEAKTMEDIAVWLDRVRNSADYNAPVLNQVGKTADGIYTFDASAELTEQALSGRYVEADQ